MINEPTYSYRELHQAYTDLLEERDELLLKLADERQRNSDLQRHCNALENAALDSASREVE